MAALQPGRRQRLQRDGGRHAAQLAVHLGDALPGARVLRVGGHPGLPLLAGALGVGGRSG